MTQATFLWEGDDAEPGVLVRLEGSDAPADVREALESELPGFQDLLALELSASQAGGRWTVLWLLVSRNHEERLHQNPESWSVLAALLAPSSGTVAVAPEAGSPWTIAVREQGRVVALRRPAEWGGEPAATVISNAPLPQVGRVLQPSSVFTPPLRARLGRLLDQAAGQEFPVLRLVPPRRTGALAFAAALSLLAAINLLLAVWSPELAPTPAAVLRVVPPQPSAVLALAADLPGVQLKAFHMEGAAWHLDLRTTEGLQALETLKKRVPALRVLQFQAEAGVYRLAVEGDGYP